MVLNDLKIATCSRRFISTMPIRARATATALGFCARTTRMWHSSHHEPSKWGKNSVSTTVKTIGLAENMKKSDTNHGKEEQPEGTNEVTSFFLNHHYELASRQTWLRKRTS
mmetsp:Transcript_28113/g.77321  ORF Transcript_28113/g.77321 Transcript_28113/m.77321 type:complete len:111 (-) Transcript_28113:147-479(-)